MNPWALLLDIRVLLTASLVAAGLYAAAQRLAKEQVKAEYAQFRANVESEAAAAKVRTAQEAARQAQNAQEVLSDLQTRYATLNARYRVLRSSSGSGPVPSIASAAPSLSPVSCSDAERNAITRFLADLEGEITGITQEGDGELAKYRELWELQKRNSGSAI